MIQLLLSKWDLCISILEFKYCKYFIIFNFNENLCISILEFKYTYEEKAVEGVTKFMYFYIRI